MTHPITPPPELVQQWAQIQPVHQAVADHWQHIATCAAQWGADQELEACCALMDDWGLEESDLRAARRPKPPSLKEQALKTVKEMSDCMSAGFVPKRSDLDTILRAIEALPND